VTPLGSPPFLLPVSPPPPPPALIPEGRGEGASELLLMASAGASLDVDDLDHGRGADPVEDDDAVALVAVALALSRLERGRQDLVRGVPVGDAGGPLGKHRELRAGTGRPPRQPTVAADRGRGAPAGAAVVSRAEHAKEREGLLRHFPPQEPLRAAANRPPRQKVRQREESAGPRSAPRRLCPLRSGSRYYLRCLLLPRLGKEGYGKEDGEGFGSLSGRGRTGAQ